MELVMEKADIHEAREEDLDNVMTLPAICTSREETTCD